ncbi:heme lyase NrfEFG subunit NrfF [Mergibacter septicus]|nr:heme lyase NrfEFG subunit NrfF [Mergibacter septicus]
MPKLYYICHLLFCLVLLQFNLAFAIVDTYQFHDQATKERAVELAKTLRCPQCQNQNLLESTSPIAYNLRLEVYQLANEGKTNQQIITIMTERFGNFVLYDPPFIPSTYFLWLLPLLLLSIAGFSIKIYLRQRNTLQLNSEQQQQLNIYLQQKGK